MGEAPGWPLAAELRVGGLVKVGRLRPWAQGAFFFAREARDDQPFFGDFIKKNPIKTHTGRECGAFHGFQVQRMSVELPLSAPQSHLCSPTC